jgi:Bacterial PH domain
VTNERRHWEEGSLTGPPPADRSADRFRQSVSPPIQNLLIASLSALVGWVWVVAWAILRLPAFMLAAGIGLTVLGLGVALAALVTYRSLRWVVYVGSDGLTVFRGTRRRVLPWAEISAVRQVENRLEITHPDGRRPDTLPIDGSQSAQAGANDILRAIDARLAARP